MQEGESVFLSLRCCCLPPPGDRRRRRLGCRPLCQRLRFLGRLHHALAVVAGFRVSTTVRLAVSTRAGVVLSCCIASAGVCLLSGGVVPGGGLGQQGKAVCVCACVAAPWCCCTTVLYYTSTTVLRKIIDYPMGHPRMTPLAPAGSWCQPLVLPWGGPFLPCPGGESRVGKGWPSNPAG